MSIWQERSPFARDSVLMYLSESRWAGGSLGEEAERGCFLVCRCLLPFPRTGLDVYSYSLPRSSQLPYGRVEASGRGRRKSEFDERCFSVSVSRLHSEGSGLDILRFLLH